MKTERLTRLSFLIAAAMILSWVESLIPAFTAVPGVKIGLANTASLFAMYYLSSKDAWIVAIVRILLSSVLFGNLFALAYSISGAVVSLITMTLLKKSGIFSVTGVSIAGAVMHNAGQVGCAMLIMETKGLMYYMVPLIFSGIAAGFAIGIISGMLLKKLSPETVKNIH